MYIATEDLLFEHTHPQAGCRLEQVGCSSSCSGGTGQQRLQAFGDDSSAAGGSIIWGRAANDEKGEALRCRSVACIFLFLSLRLIWTVHV